MNLDALSVAKLQQKLSTEGVIFRTGPFTVCLQSPIESVARGIHLLYGQYPLVEAGEFVDFYVRLARPRGLRRWLKPQVEFGFDGNHPFKPLPLVQAFPMFEWTFNWCIANHMHRYLVVHGAVVERNGMAAILPAPPGSGKSTLCAALVSRGWRLFSDELALISLHDGQLVPLPRPVSLKNESIDIMKDYAADAVFGPSYLDTKKGTIGHMKSPLESVERAGEHAKATWIVMPKYASGVEACLTPVSKAKMCMLLAENSFNYSLLGEAGFKILTEMMDGCESYRFDYSHLDDAIATFDALEPTAE